MYTFLQLPAHQTSSQQSPMRTAQLRHTGALGRMLRFIFVPVPEPWPQSIRSGPVVHMAAVLSRILVDPALAIASSDDTDGLIFLGAILAAVSEIGAQGVSDNSLAFVRAMVFDRFVAWQSVQEIDHFNEESVRWSVGWFLFFGAYWSRRCCGVVEEEDVRVLEVGEVLADPCAEMLPYHEAIVYQRLIRDGKPDPFHQISTLRGDIEKMFRHFEHGECPIVGLIGG